MYLGRQRLCLRRVLFCVTAVGYGTQIGVIEARSSIIAKVNFSLCWPSRRDDDERSQTTGAI